MNSVCPFPLQCSLSDVVIHQMKNKLQSRTDLTFEVMDACKVCASLSYLLFHYVPTHQPHFFKRSVISFHGSSQTSFNAEEFDVVLDKSLFDCLLCGSVAAHSVAWNNIFINCLHATVPCNIKIGDLLACKRMWQT